MRRRSVVCIALASALICAGLATHSLVRASAATAGELAFASNVTGNMEIYTTSSDGTGRTNVSNNPGYDVNPAWSPDGATLAWVTDRFGNEQIVTANADGTNVVDVSNSSTTDGTPRWSPDGQSIAFFRGAVGNFQIWTMSATGANQTQLTQLGGAGTDNRTPAWSPDGSKIAFCHLTSGTTNYDIAVMNADGTGMTVLTTDPGDDCNPTYSPDGSKIYFDSDRNGSAHLFVMNADGSNQTDLSGAGHQDFSAAISPDGTQLAFTCVQPSGAWEICLMGSGGSGRSIVTNDGALAGWPTWQPSAPIPPTTTTSTSTTTTTTLPPVLNVSPTSGLPGTTFTASWQCPAGAIPSIKIVNGNGIAVFGNPLPVSGNGTDYVASFQGAGSPGSYKVTASCSGAALTPVPISLIGASYVALGDSHASGEGATGFESGSDQPGTDMCHRATSGYAEQISIQLGYVEGTTFDFAACSGAVIPDIYNQNSQNPSEIAQLFHLSSSTQLVTISIGGNDVGFEDVLNDCLLVTPFGSPFTHTGGYGCAARNTARMQTALGWLINGRPAGCYQLPGTDPNTGVPETVCGAQVSLSQLYEDLHSAAPHAKIRVVGYPQLWGSNFTPGGRRSPATCSVAQAYNFFTATVSEADADWLNTVGLQLNNKIASSVHQAAQATGADIKFVGVDAAFEHHRLCDTQVSWFNQILVDRNGSHLTPDPRSLHPDDVGQSSGYYATLKSRI
jgi:hypothetical protein